MLRRFGPFSAAISKWPADKALSTSDHRKRSDPIASFIWEKVVR